MGQSPISSYMNEAASHNLFASAERPLTVGSAVHAKYGKAAIAGFQAVPDLLLKHQHDLGLSATDLVVLRNVLTNWRYPGAEAVSRSTSIAKRMGVTPRTVQRSLQQMEELGFLIREKNADGPDLLRRRAPWSRSCRS